MMAGSAQLLREVSERLVPWITGCVSTSKLSQFPGHSVFFLGLVCSFPTYFISLFHQLSVLNVACAGLQSGRRLCQRGTCLCQCGLLQGMPGHRSCQHTAPCSCGSVPAGAGGCAAESARYCCAVSFPVQLLAVLVCFGCAEPPCTALADLCEPFNSAMC